MWTYFRKPAVHVLGLFIAVTAMSADHKTEIIDASKYFFYRDYDTALDKIAAVLAEDPDNVSALELRGRIEIMNGDLDAALATFDEAIAADAEDYRGWQGKGEVLARTYNLDDALEAYSIAVENNKKASSSLYALAVIYARKSDKDNSLKYLEKAIKTNPFLKDTALEEPHFQGFRGDSQFWAILN
jgi:tetratricopeptide (TPR) repeat protein